MAPTRTVRMHLKPAVRPSSSLSRRSPCGAAALSREAGGAVAGGSVLGSGASFSAPKRLRRTRLEVEGAEIVDEGKAAEGNGVAWGPVGMNLPRTTLVQPQPFPSSSVRPQRGLCVPAFDSVRARVMYSLSHFVGSSELGLIVRESNVYAEARARAGNVAWARRVGARPLTEMDLTAYLSVRLIMALRHAATDDDVYSGSFPHALRSGVGGNLPLSKQRFNDVDSALHCQSLGPGVPNLHLPSADKSCAGKKVGPSSGAMFNLEADPKVGTLLGMFQERCTRALACGAYDVGQSLSVDEAMVRFQGPSRKVFRRQPKPTSMGMKFTVLSDPSGFCVAFYPEPGPGLGLKVREQVLALASFAPPRVVLHFDNLFCNLGTLRKLADMGVRACGTVRRNGGAPPMTDLDEHKAKHGDSAFAMAGLVKNEFGAFTVVGGHWMDSCKTRFLSTAHDGSTRSVSRRVKGHVGRVEVDCPEALADYNRLARGVDTADQKRATLTVQRRTRKWWKAVFACMVVGLGRDQRTPRVQAGFRTGDAAQGVCRGAVQGGPGPRPFVA